MWPARTPIHITGKHTDGSYSDASYTDISYTDVNNGQTNKRTECWILGVGYWDCLGPNIKSSQRYHPLQPWPSSSFIPADLILRPSTAGPRRFEWMQQLNIQLLAHPAPSLTIADWGFILPSSFNIRLIRLCHFERMQLIWKYPASHPFYSKHFQLSTNLNLIVDPSN